MLKEAVFSSLITVVTDQSLNPYFNGTCSKSLQTASAYLFALGLNPYFNGTCSKRMAINVKITRPDMS